MSASAHVVHAALPGARLGDGVSLGTHDGRALYGEVVAIEPRRVAIAPFGSASGVALGRPVAVDPAAFRCVLGFGALGRSFDGTGAALDGGGPLRGAFVRVARDASAFARRPVAGVLWTGVRALDGLLTIARGARVGLFGAPGCGKSSLLETIARAAQADAVVVALIGERGREAEPWLGDVPSRASVVCATSERSAAERIRAAEVAMAQAVHLRERGCDVLLVLDSLARYAQALRERAVAFGEPVGRGGYPATVWPGLARYLECAGPSERGSVTLLATVLCESDDDEPLVVAARSLLDGHLVLSREAARAGRFPAFDIGASLSRTMRSVVTLEHGRAALRVRAALAMLDETRDVRGAGLADLSDPVLARAVAAEAELASFVHHPGISAPAETLEALVALSARVA